MHRTFQQPYLLVLLTVLCFLVMLLFATLSVVAVSQAAGLDLLAVQAGTAVDPDRQAVRWAMLLNNFLLFAGTAILVFVLVFRRQAVAAAGLAELPRRRPTLLVSLLFLVALPLIGFSAYWNLQLDLPSWAVRGEEQTSAVIEQILTMPSVAEFLTAFLTIAVVPAVGEELLFRGLIQRRILGNWLDGQAPVWITAVVFSAVHLEFAGFLPRLLLGALLGYAYYFTNSLWVPIVLHLLFNGLQVVMTYYSGEFTPDTELPELPHWSVAIVSALLTAWIFRRLQALPPTAPNSGAVPSPPAP